MQTSEARGRADLARNDSAEGRWVKGAFAATNQPAPAHPRPRTLCKPGVTYSITLSLIRCDSSSPIKSGALNKCFLPAEFLRRLNGRLSPPERFSFLRLLRCLLFHHGWRSKMVVGTGGRDGGGSSRNVKSTGISLLRATKKGGENKAVKINLCTHHCGSGCQGGGETRQLECRHISSSNEVALEWERCSFVSQAF